MPALHSLDFACQNINLRLPIGLAQVKASNTP